MNLIDSHAHLEALEDLNSALKNAQEAGVGTIITIGTSIKSSKKAIEIAQKYSTNDLQIYATIGIHPQDGKDEVEKLGLNQCIGQLKKILRSAQNDKRGSQNNKVVAIGECGLDYFLETGNKRQATSSEEKEFQKKLFTAQIELAGDLNMPLIIHCRNAWDDVFTLLTSIVIPAKAGIQTRAEDWIPHQVRDDKKDSSLIHLRNNLKGVFHSFTGNRQDAQKALSLGFYISFSGIATFKNASDIQEAAKNVPLDRTLVETDSPFLSPEPIRGTKNEPKNVQYVAEFLAKLKDTSLDKLSRQISQNAAELFKLG